VSAYNTVVGALHQQLDYSGSTAGTETLFGDSTLMQLEGALDTITTGQLGNGQSLASLGLQIDKTGQMSLDTDTLDSALASDPNALSTIFVGQNVSKTFTDLINGYTEAGDGILSQQVQGYSDEETSLQQQIDTIDSNATTLQTQLQDEFNNLETVMSKLNSQSSYVSKILAA
jgi:flagellar hook-associated protein 2